MRFGKLVFLLVFLAVLTACSAMVGPQDDLARKVDYMRSDVEKLTAQQKELAEQVKQLADALAKAPTQAPQEQAPQATTPQVVSRAESGDLAGDPSLLYKRAYDLLAAGKVKESQDAFSEFIRRFPQSDLADNAQYWIGEGFYTQKDFKDARDAFKAVADHFPFGNKVPDAIYKEALCDGEMGDKALEKKRLQELCEQYPYSEAAALAKDLLKKL
jgi:tol-pal system protein YbgF